VISFLFSSSKFSSSNFNFNLWSALGAPLLSSVVVNYNTRGNARGFFGIFLNWMEEAVIRAGAAAAKALVFMDLADNLSGRIRERAKRVSAATNLPTHLRRNSL
jgi:hypothetical protein